MTGCNIMWGAIGGMQGPLIEVLSVDNIASDEQFKGLT